MKINDMPYDGRMPIAFITPEGKPGAGYRIQVRSLPNKKRKFEPRADRLYVAPLDPEDLNRDDANLIFYNTMLRKGDMIIVTNGAQTDVGNYKGKQVRNFHDNFISNDISSDYAINAANAIMADWGPEPDSMNTPRVALVRWPHYALFSIATKHGDKDGIGSFLIIPPEEIGRGLPTYTARDEKAVSLSVSGSDEVPDCLVDVPILGSTPQEIADYLFYSSEENLVIAAAAAVFENGKWEVAFTNKFNDLEEFAAYKKLVEAKK